MRSSLRSGTSVIGDLVDGLRALRHHASIDNEGNCAKAPIRPSPDSSSKIRPHHRPEHGNGGQPPTRSLSPQVAPTGILSFSTMLNGEPFLASIREYNAGGRMSLRRAKPNFQALDVALQLVVKYLSPDQFCLRLSLRANLQSNQTYP